MRIIELTESSVRKFRIEGNRILMTRMGPINAQKQTHKDSYQPPDGINRGMWAFPWPFFEPFFTSHIATKKIPKRLQKMPEWPKRENYETQLEYDEANRLYDIELTKQSREYSEKYKMQKQLNRRSNFWWSGPIFARFGPANQQHSNGWYLWQSPREYAEYAARVMPVARMQRPKWTPGDKDPEYVGYKSGSQDHMEVFLPMTAKFK